MIENALTENEAKINLAKSLKEYSEEFYADFGTWGAAQNRKKHISFVLKTILVGNISEITELIQIAE